MIRGYFAPALAISLAELAKPMARLKNITALIEPSTVSCRSSMIKLTSTQAWINDNITGSPQLITPWYSDLLTLWT